MAALEDKVLAGYRVKIWKTSFRVEGMSSVIHVGHHLTDQIIEDYIAEHYPTERKGRTTMNMNSLAALVRDDITTLTCRFPSGPKLYFFKVSRELADTLIPDDNVIVKCANGFKVVEVVEIHDEPEIDPDSDIDYAWAFQRVDTTSLEEQQWIENRLVERLTRERRTSQRQQALAAMGIYNPSALLAEIGSTTQGK